MVSRCGWTVYVALLCLASASTACAGRWPWEVDRGADAGVDAGSDAGTAPADAGGDAGASEADAGVPDAGPSTHLIGGTLSGLAGTGLVLTLTDTDASTGLSDTFTTNAIATGAVVFSFATPIASGHAYAVAVTTQPSGPSQTCTVANGSGTVGDQDIGDIAVACVTDSYGVSGSVAGLTAGSLGVTLTDETDGNGSRAFTVAAGSASFSVEVTDGHAYALTVSSQPSAWQTCAVANGSGTVSGADVQGVSIACTTQKTLTVQLSGTDVVGAIAISASGTNGGDGVAISGDGTVASSRSYVLSFTYVASGDDALLYTIALTAADYVFTPASVSDTLSNGIGSGAVSFVASCGDGYGACGLGCCPQAVALSAGGRHSCAVMRGGGVKCWGDGSYGQLGDGASSGRLVPVAVADSATSYAAITSGDAYSCAVAGTGAAKCWGYNASGQLGDGTQSDRAVPTLVSGAASYAALAAGDGHSCGLTLAGAVQCWGAGSYGQLGGGSATSSGLSPVAVRGTDVYSVVAAGGRHTCGVTDAGYVKCWGYNGYGQLGNASLVNYALPTRISIEGSDADIYARVAAGENHTCGILATRRTARCWGYNALGQLGDGTTTRRVSPVDVSGAESYAALAAGGDHTCGITLDAGSVQCWGDNASGQLGDQSTTRRTAPVALSDSSPYSVIAVGSSHTCGITLDAGTVKCWGDNTYGQLGDGTTTSRSTPVDVAF